MDAAESAWQKLDRHPSDAGVQRDYNSAVSQIFGTLRDAKLLPWTAPIQAGSHTLSWQRHPDPE